MYLEKDGEVDYEYGKENKYVYVVFIDFKFLNDDYVVQYDENKKIIVLY